MFRRAEWGVYKVKEHYGAVIPVVFSSLVEARESFYYLWHKFAYEVHSLGDFSNPEFPAVLEEWQRKSSSLLDRWSTALEAFVQGRHNTLSQRELSAAEILRIQRCCAFQFTHLKGLVSGPNTLGRILSHF